MGTQSKLLNANSSKPSFRGNETAAPSSASTSPSTALNEDKFEKKDEIKPKNKLFITLAAVAGASTAGLTFTWARLGKILKLMGVAVPFALFGRLSKVHELSLKDGLTGLFNKKNLIATLNEGYQKAVQKKQNYSVAMLDMDNFKAFNEIFDHNTGDDVLKRISNCIHGVVKKHKIKGFRYGGEEFTVLMPNHNNESAKKVIEEIAEAIKKDADIQKLLPKFTKISQEDIAFVSPKLIQINDIFTKLREKSGNSRQIANEIVSVVEEHIKKYEPTDAKSLKDFVTKLKTTEGSELHKLLHIDSKVGVDSILGNELDKIYKQYSSIKHDREKWLGHITRHNMFTVSGGVVDLQDSKIAISSGEYLTGIADEALKSAKENGKNVIITANDELIKSAIDKINKKNANK
jgi:diguanylate cyclase (GGDEF)-like protein